MFGYFIVFAISFSAGIMVCLFTWSGSYMRLSVTSKSVWLIIYVIGKSLQIWMIVSQMQHLKSSSRKLSTAQWKQVAGSPLLQCDLHLLIFRSDATCIICREEMTTAKKLLCGHLFHVHCLRSWLERQNTCPTCRAPVVPPENGTTTTGTRAEGHQQGVMFSEFLLKFFWISQNF